MTGPQIVVCFVCGRRISLMLWKKLRPPPVKCACGKIIEVNEET